VTILALQDRPNKFLSQALAQFEHQFVYPLGPDDSFRISHGSNYPIFCRAMGEGCCFVYEENGIVLGTIGVSIRPVAKPDGEQENVAYLCDVKVQSSPRRGFILLRLMRAVHNFCRSRTSAAFCVVMDGTAVTPNDYTGRSCVPIPAFAVLGKIAVLKISTANSKMLPVPDENMVISNESNVRNILGTLGRGRYLCQPGDTGSRSKMPPLWLALTGDTNPESTSQTACACLEDTYLAKQLIGGNGQAMASAHLSAFAYSDTGIGADIIGAGAYLAGLRGCSEMFTSVPYDQAPELCTILRDLHIEVVLAAATIYGLGLGSKNDKSDKWMINSSEI